MSVVSYAPAVLSLSLVSSSSELAADDDENNNDDEEEDEDEDDDETLLLKWLALPVEEELKFADDAAALRADAAAGVGAIPARTSTGTRIMSRANSNTKMTLTNELLRISMTIYSTL